MPRSWQIRTRRAAEVACGSFLKQLTCDQASLFFFFATGKKGDAWSQVIRVVICRLSAWQASEGEGTGKDERVKREKIGLGRIAYLLPPALILTFLPFYGLPRKLFPRRWTRKRNRTFFLSCISLMLSFFERKQFFRIDFYFPTFAHHKIYWEHTTLIPVAGLVLVEAFPSFPWPKLRHCSHSSIVTIIYLINFQHYNAENVCLWDYFQIILLAGTRTKRDRLRDCLREEHIHKNPQKVQ